MTRICIVNIRLLNRICRWLYTYALFLVIFHNIIGSSIPFCNSLKNFVGQKNPTTFTLIFGIFLPKNWLLGLKEVFLRNGSFFFRIIF